MTERPEFRREPVYYHSRDIEETQKLLRLDRWKQIILPLYQQLFYEPSLQFHRGLYASLLWELYVHPEEARKEGYSEIEIIASIIEIQEIATHYGLILGSEIQQMHHSEKPFNDIDASTKYASWDEIVGYAQNCSDKGEIIALTHGAFDPAHVGHGAALASVWAYADHVIVGFDTNTLLRQRKGHDRPRFPQLAWRMWEIANLPTVDKVFVIPINNTNDEEYFELYKKLNIKVLGTSQDNPYLERYQERMQQLGGIVVAKERRVTISSTQTIQDLTEISKEGFFAGRLTQLHNWVSERENFVRSLGFLHDYPNGT